MAYLDITGWELVPSLIIYREFQQASCILPAVFKVSFPQVWICDLHQKSTYFAINVACNSITLIREAFLKHSQPGLFKCATSSDYHFAATHILRVAETSQMSTLSENAAVKVSSLLHTQQLNHFIPTVVLQQFSLSPAPPNIPVRALLTLNL